MNPRIPRKHNENHVITLVFFRIMKINFIFRIPNENHENKENDRISSENHENHKNLRIPRENYENH